ncbi:MAG: GNAT family N-acetyltransferase [Actinobacteria bacterium]|nr:GNAT family N-acetyltransferase [Actinomycetota bacterium]
MPKRRLGVALLVPAPWAGEIEGLRRALGDGTLGRMPAHLTLVPPVNVREDRLDDALAVVRAAARRAAPLTITLGPPATFLPDTPVLYLRVGGPGVAGIHRLRDEVFVEPLARSLTWSFEPHVTVADDAPPERIAAACAALADYSVEATFDRVHLLEEGPGRVWRPIADIALERPAVVARGGLELELAVSDHLDPQAARLSHHWACGGEGRVPVAITGRRQGTVVGTLTGCLDAGVAHLFELVVAPAERRQGIASHLLARFLAEAAARGAHRARTAAGTAADDFLLARGWRPVPGQPVLGKFAHLPGARRSPEPK